MKSSQSLQSQMHQMLPQGNGNQENKGEKIDTDVLKIMNKTIVFDNSLYQIQNICTVQLADFTRTDQINQTVPTWYWFLLGLGIILLFYGIGIFILVYVGWLFWQHNKLEKSLTVEKYGLRIVMNSREDIILTSSNREFVLKIIVTLYAIMNNDGPKAVAFNFKTLNVEDRSIKIDQAYGSAVISGHVGNDVVNMI